MRLALRRGSFVVLAMLLLGGCVGSGGSAGQSDYLTERDAARRYLISNAAESAAAEATEQIRQAGSEQDRDQIDAYLADPAHARQLPAKYQDYLVEVFDASAIDEMTAGSGPSRQVMVHRFVLAQSLVEWHIERADLEGSAVFDDPLAASLISVIRATPDALIPASRQG